MKVSLNLAQKFSNVPLSDIGVDKLIEKIGSQLGAVEEVVHTGKKYDGILVAKVVSCIKHPDADKLSVCMIDDGGKVKNVERGKDGLIQVVCGAPNVREGLMVAWIPPGATVPSSVENEPFVLEARVLRGQLSNGMIASPHELAMGDNHEGILEVDEPNAIAGQLLKDLYKLDDVIIDIENKMFTHRPDCFGVLGVAREIAGIQGKKFVSPEWYKNDETPVVSSQDIPVKLQVDDPASTPRFMAVSIKNVTVKPSPMWLQICLVNAGMKPINNIVDITNYVMYLTGQPLHAYDADKLPEMGSLTARPSNKGEKLSLLNGKTIEMLDSDSIIIASGGTAVGVGGVMGGKDTEVSSDTKNIILECASFDMYSIRKTSMKYGLFTDAVSRFNKGQSSLQNPAVIAYAIELLKEISGGEQASNVADVSSDKAKLGTVKTDADFINKRLGTDLSNSDITKLLDNVEFDTMADSELNIVAPFWRTDIEIPEDIVEEIGRLHGYDNLPVKLPQKQASPAIRNTLLDFKTEIRNILSSAGGNELNTYSFVHSNLINKVGQKVEHAYELSNALSPDLQYYRMSLVPSLLEKVHPNIKTGHDEFLLFEISKTHSKMHGDENKLPKELDTLAAVYAHKSSKLSAFYEIKNTLNFMASKIGISLKIKPIKDDQEYPATAVFENSRSAKIFVSGNSEAIGIVGEFSASSIQSLKLPSACAGFELDLERLLESISDKPKYKKLSKFPSVQQDITIKVNEEINYQTIYDLLAGELLDKPDVASLLTPLDIYQKEGKESKKQYSFRFKVAHHQKTLKSEEVNAMLDNAAEVAKTKIGAERI